MTTIAIIGNAACANKFIEMIKKHGKHTNFTVQFVPKNLPAIVDDVDLIKNLIPKEVFSADVVLDYSGHPDVPYALRDAKKVITSGKCGSSRINVKFTKCFCAADISGEFGIPEFEIELDNGIIKNIKVIKSSPCGAAYFLADKLKGMKIEDALSKAGLLTQNACKGSGGPLGTMHQAAEIHSKALEKAVKRD
jgi:hypothetical protein